MLWYELRCKRKLYDQKIMVWSTVFQERAAERDGEDADPREETDSVSEDDEDDQGILFKE